MAKVENGTSTKTLFEMVCTKIVQQLADLPLSERATQRKLGANKMLKLTKSVEKLVRDSVSVRFKSPPGYASIHKNSSAYSHDKLGKHFTYRVTVGRAYEGMVKLGYLEETKAGVSNGSYGLYLTRYQATPKLMAEFQDVDVRLLPVIIPTDPNEHPIRVQASHWEVVDGHRVKRTTRIPTPDLPEVQAMEERLQRINAALLRSWVDLETPDDELGLIQSELFSDASSGSDPVINFSKRTLYRVFNDIEFARGGRFYGGWWQSIPSRYRSRITVNGKPMVEYDYSGLHPAILYAEKGMVPPDDPYTGIVLPRSHTEEGLKEARDVAKKAFNAMVNSLQPMSRQPDGIKLSKFGMNWAEVSNRVLEKHSTISDAFYSDSGAGLQRVDSDMAEEIMLDFAELGVVVLPVHDSFLVHSGYESRLEELMIEAFEKRFGMKPKLKASRRYVRPSSLSDEDTTLDLTELLALMNNGHELRLREWLRLRQSQGKEKEFD